MSADFIVIGRRLLEAERLQLEDEGRDAGPLPAAFKAVESLDLDRESAFQPLVDKLLDLAAECPMRPGFRYEEPSDLAAIRAARPAGPRVMPLRQDDKTLLDRVYGAWLGRCAGCLLGKPLESWYSWQIWGYLKDTGQYPLRNYVRGDVPKKILRKHDITIWRDFCFAERIKHMVEDDDTNYTVMGLAILRQYGREFTPEHVAGFWMQHLPINHTCTAEHLAYRNFAMGIAPPQSATFRNPCREWIGAQIRGDFFGYAALGNPQLAAEFAWRDACISHVKNGIYGEMWVAAMLAAAASENNMRKVIQIGLSEIPARSRLAEAIRDVLLWHRRKVTFRDAVRRIHKRWPEKILHYCGHTVANAQIVAAGLLWGEGDFEKTICLAVEACYDTDCNGATAGSVVGMLLGAARLPAKWVAPLNDTLETGVAVYPRLVKISDLAREGFEVYKRIRKPTKSA